jgi:hypothetical protein
MSVCRGCGQPIDWIRTKAGKNMPVDLRPVMVIEGEGRDVFITDEGATITGRRAAPPEERPTLPVGFVPHWATCTAAGEFRRKQK